MVAPTEYTVQVVRNLRDMKRGIKVTHGRSVAHAYDNTRDPATFCGKQWRHKEYGYIFFWVDGTVARSEAIDRISCVACQAALA